MELFKPVEGIPNRRTFAGIVAGDKLPLQIYPITRGDLVNYVGISGDPNPIHYSDITAKALGLPGVLAQGMLTMGLVTGYLTDWAGNPAALAEFEVKFSHPVIVPEDSPALLEVQGQIKTIVTESKTVTVMVDVRAATKKVFSKAVAKLILD